MLTIFTAVLAAEMEVGMQLETIFAVASGAGRSAVAVIRLSGPQVQSILIGLTGRVPQPRRATLLRLRDGSSAETIDQGLVLWFPAPGSFTGEDCAELQVHGSRAVIARLVRYLAALSMVRPAEAGEFTRRAFLNGRMDLTQVEGLADLIDSETEQQRRQSLSQLDGVLGRKTEIWRSRLMEALAFAEADIDFIDEGDAPTDVNPHIKTLIAPLILDIQKTLKTAQSGEMLRDGLLVVICGCPNVGKSTFLNVMAKRDVALVSEHAGTTRDALEIFLDLEGLPVRMIDTAGLQVTDNPVEKSGIAKAHHYIGQADLVLWLYDLPVSQKLPADIGSSASLWRVRTKIDRADYEKSDCDYEISSAKGTGIAALLTGIAEFAQTRLAAGGAGMMLRERHRLAFKQTLVALERVNSAGCDDGPELVAEDLRLAARSLGRVTGRAGVEDVLDDIFMRFCIGK